MAGLLVAVSQSLALLQIAGKSLPDARRGLLLRIGTNAHLVAIDGQHHHLDIITDAAIPNGCSCSRAVIGKNIIEALRLAKKKHSSLREISQNSP